MKKLFALLMVAVMTMAMSVSVFADEVVIRGEEGNGSFDLSAYESGTLCIAFKTTADTIAEGFKAGWGIGSLCENVDGWPNLDGYAINLPEDPTDGGVYSVDFDLAAAKAAGAAVVNIWGGATLVSVTVITSGAAAGDVMPVASVAMVAVVACAAFVVLRKKET